MSTSSNSAPGIPGPFCFAARRTQINLRAIVHNWQDAGCVVFGVSPDHTVWKLTPPLGAGLCLFEALAGGFAIPDQGHTQGEVAAVAGVACSASVRRSLGQYAARDALRISHNTTATNGVLTGCP
jgi:hypothetical protein